MECAAHADDAVVRRLWPTVRWLPVAHHVHQRPLRSAAWTYGAPRPIATRTGAGCRAAGVGLPGPMIHGDRSAAAIRVRPAPQVAGARPVAGAASAAATVRTGG